MSDYITTNLRFPKTVYRELRHHAERRRVALASVVREAVEQYLGRSDTVPPIPFGDDPADAIIGSLDHGARDESTQHDHYLYGWPKETAREASGGHERSAGADDAARPASRPRRQVRQG